MEQPPHLTRLFRNESSGGGGRGYMPYTKVLSGVATVTASHCVGPFRFERYRPPRLVRFSTLLGPASQLYFYYITKNSHKENHSAFIAVVSATVSSPTYKGGATISNAEPLYGLFARLHLGCPVIYLPSTGISLSGTYIVPHIVYVHNGKTPRYTCGKLPTHSKRLCQ